MIFIAKRKFKYVGPSSKPSVCGRLFEILLKLLKPQWRPVTTWHISNNHGKMWCNGILCLSQRWEEIKFSSRTSRPISSNTSKTHALIFLLLQPKADSRVDLFYHHPLVNLIQTDRFYSTMLEILFFLSSSNQIIAFPNKFWTGKISLVYWVPSKLIVQCRYT